MLYYILGCSNSIYVMFFYFSFYVFFLLLFSFMGCLVYDVKNFGVSYRMFHGISEGVFGYK
jgi:hypothetical protein